MADLTGTTCPGVGCVVLNLGNSQFLGIQLTGTWSAVAAIQGSVDNVNYSALCAVNIADTTNTRVITATTNGVFVASVGGLSSAKIILTSYTSGTTTVTTRITK